MKREKLYIDLGDNAKTIPCSIDKGSLFELLNENCVFYVECFRKCGRSETCRFTDNLKHRGDDQKCAAVSTVLKNYLDCTFSIFKKLNLEKKQKYLNATVKFIDLAWSLESGLGNIIENKVVKWYGDLAPALFGSILNYRRLMQEIASLFRGIKPFRAQMKVYLVEGESDKALLNELARGPMLNFRDLRNTDIIYGGDNTRKPRLDLLLKNKCERAEESFLILDGDGKKGKKLNSLNRLWKQKLIKKKHIFIFRDNIELSFPQKMLFEATVMYKKFYKIAQEIKESDIEDLMSKKGDFIKKLSEKLNTNVVKITFDKILGCFLASIVTRDFNKIMNRESPYHQYEIFKLLEFIQKGA